VSLEHKKGKERGIRISQMLGDIDKDASKTRIKKARVVSRQEGGDCTKEWSRGTAGLFEGYDERSTVWTSANCVRKWKIGIGVPGKLTSTVRHILKA
jgi:hypothetical protein